MSEKLPLLIVAQAGEHMSFSPPSQGGSKVVSYSYGDRVEHANKILQQFDEIILENAREKVNRITLKTQDGKDFPVDRLNKSQMELLDWREVEDGYAATVLLSGKADEELRKKITDFRDVNTRETNKPKNEDFVGRIGAFQRAIPDWYWKDAVVTLPEDEEIWIEIWLTRKDAETEADDFIELCKSSGIIYGKAPLCFPEYLVYIIHANRPKLAVLTVNLDSVKQCRACRELTSLVTSASPAEQAQWSRHLIERLQIPSDDAPRVCILDSGCIRHPILSPLIQDGVLLCADDKKSGVDEDGHGTSMAGIAAYGNLNHEMMNAIGAVQPHPIESCRIFGLADNDRLHGEVTLRAVSLVEITSPEAPRVFCMAITSQHQTKVLGNPTSWSAALDSSASMYGEESNDGRLFIVSAGNWTDHLCASDGLAATVHNPAQAWNVLSIGAVTHLTEYNDSSVPANAKLFAKDGELSPWSSNSSQWKESAPIKPDFLCEGGNIVVVDGVEDKPDDLCLLSPYKEEFRLQYIPFEGTSLASALATHMAACIMREYPSIRPETVRALLVHSAEWTDEMKHKYLPAKPSASSYMALARMCGHGEASLSRALSCMSNSLTLVHEGELTPYGMKDGKSVTYNEMVYHDLPWPKAALEALGDASVELKVTLSYFVEPNPSAIEGLESSYSYPSYSLCFSVRKSVDTREMHLKKINRAIREANDSINNRNQYDGWQLGRNAFVGSVHSDIWEGSAIELAAMGGIAIIPEAGWWKTKKASYRFNEKARYSLIVSIRTKEIHSEINLYAEVENKIKNELQTEVEITA